LNTNDDNKIPLRIKASLALPRFYQAIWINSLKVKISFFSEVKPLNTVRNRFIEWNWTKNLMQLIKKQTPILRDYCIQTQLLGYIQTDTEIYKHKNNASWWNGYLAMCHQVTELFFKNDTLEINPRLRQLKKSDTIFFTEKINGRCTICLPLHSILWVMAWKLNNTWSLETL
jgi:hypothetical protein